MSDFVTITVLSPFPLGNSQLLHNEKEFLFLSHEEGTPVKFTLDENYLYVLSPDVPLETFHELCRTIHEGGFKAHVVIWTWKTDQRNYDHLTCYTFVRIIRSRGEGDEIESFYSLYLEAFFPVPTPPKSLELPVFQPSEENQLLSSSGLYSYSPYSGSSSFEWRRPWNSTYPSTTEMIREISRPWPMPPSSPKAPGLLKAGVAGGLAVFGFFLLKSIFR